MIILVFIAMLTFRSFVNLLSYEIDDEIEMTNNEERDKLLKDIFGALIFISSVVILILITIGRMLYFN